MYPVLSVAVVIYQCGKNRLIFIVSDNEINYPLICFHRIHRKSINITVVEVKARGSVWKEELELYVREEILYGCISQAGNSQQKASVFTKAFSVRQGGLEPPTN